MKKIVAIFLLLAIMTVFVSCGGNDKDKETTLSPYQGTQATTEQKDTNGSTTADQSANAGYILTTDPNQTAPWGITTAFQTTLPTTTQPSTIPIPSITDNQGSTAINPSFSQVSTTEREQTTNEKGPTVVDAVDNTTTKPTTETTTSEIAKEEKVVSIGAKSWNPDSGKIYVDFDTNGWDSPIVTRSTKVTVGYASKSESAPCTINQGELVVDVSGLELYSGATVKITVPEGAVVSTTGANYNRAFTVSFTL